MTILFTIPTLILLSILTYQDFKYRAITWYLIPAILILFLLNGFLTLQFVEYGSYMLLNLSILAINLLGVTLIVSIKNKKAINIIDTYLGLGDILFFLLLTTAFSPFNFMLFYIGSVCIGLISFLILRLIRKKTSNYFPLAGCASLVLIVLIFLQHVYPAIQFYTDIIFWV